MGRRSEMYKGLAGFKGAIRVLCKKSGSQSQIGVRWDGVRYEEEEVCINQLEGVLLRR